MRHFHSYGPVSCKQHFCVPRTELIKHCTEQLVGHPQEGGHYFTIWAPRQNGKTWLMRQVEKTIRRQYSDQFAVFSFSLGRLRGMNWELTEQSDKIKFPSVLEEVLKHHLPGRPVVDTWEKFNDLFTKDKGLWDRPLILMIDEADTAPPALLDLLAGQFREMYLNRHLNCLHGLALIGIRAVLGIESERGSPFNIQRALHVPNFTSQEVNDLFGQYQLESSQVIAPEVVNQVYTSTNGQPGLVCWFGELLTEKYNTDVSKVIDMETWKLTWRKACTVEWNNTVLNLIKKARSIYMPYVVELFTKADIPFKLHSEWCNYLYLNGVIDYVGVIDEKGVATDFCRFSSPFVQQCLYNALIDDLIGDRMPMLALDPLDELEDVFRGPKLNVTALLGRYKDYLARLKAKGINPWKDQPRRKDLHYTEAVGHFHLYHWLQNAIGRFCVISPEFPTGNGKVDLHLKCGEKNGLIEVKSFSGALQLKEARKQAAAYARQCGFKSVAMALFAPVDDEAVLEKLSVDEMIDKVNVQVTAIGWV